MGKYICTILFYLSIYTAHANIFIVTTATPTGVGSLSQAITDANALPGLDTINFNSSYTIVLTAALPALTDPVFINGMNSPSPQIEINGNTNNVIGAGILIAGSATGSIIKGLNIHGMQWQGILVAASNCRIIGCYIGTNLNGNSSIPNAFAGIEIAPNLFNIKIGGSSSDSSNVISGNGQLGINIGSNCTNIKISGNKIGTNATGTAALGNSQNGILAFNTNNLILGGGVNERNIISGNRQHGLVLNSCTSVKISNNYVGTDVSGTFAISNFISGIQLNQTPAIIGGITSDSSNVISGNLAMGLDITNTNGLVFFGNYIGTSANGLSAIGNDHHGIQLIGCSNVIIGSGIVNSRNVISGNDSVGVNIINTNGVLMANNYIGLGSDGLTSIGNGQHGVQLFLSSNAIIGGSTYLEKNVISSNRYHGILIDRSNTIRIKGNFIGTDKTGTQQRGNISHGIQLQFGASDIIIGGKRYVDGNILSCNGGTGINFEDFGAGTLAANGTIIKGNLIGTDSTGTQNFGNRVIGVIIKSDNCIIGDTTNQEGNVIAGSKVFCGLLIANGNNNIVQGNSIGVGLSGTNAIPNTQDGVLIAVETNGKTANNNIIRYNTIAYNGRYGVNVGLALNSNINNNEFRNIIRFNKIYCNISLGIFLNLSNTSDQGNNGQKAPRIDFFLSTSNVIYGVTDASLAGKKIDLYLVVDCPNCDINPQGKIWIDSTIVNGSGAWSYDYFAKFGTIIPNEVVTTVTDLTGNTSQFSTCCHATSGLSIVPSANPICPGTIFSITYSNGQSGDSLMLQSTLDTIAGIWINVQAKAMADPIVFNGLTLADTTFYRFISYSQGTFSSAACKDSSFIKRIDLALLPIAGTASINPDTICQGSSTSINLTGSSGNIQWQRSVSGNSFVSIPGATNSSYTDYPTFAQNTILYRAKVSRSICPDVFSNAVKVLVIKVNGIISGDHNVCNGSPTILNLAGSSNNIIWQDSLTGNTWQTITGQTSNALPYKPSDITSENYIRAIITDPTGNCTDTTNVFQLVSEICTAPQPIEIPNALTPNNDGNNDVFYIYNIWLYPNNKIYIYNRWGNKVYEGSGYLNDWDGTRNGEKLPEATYYYVLELGEDLNGNKNDKNQYTGYVVIVR